MVFQVQRDVPPTTAKRTTDWWARHRLALATAACALLTILLSVSLPLAPVLVNEPTVRWPVDRAHPAPTLLNLTSYRPLELDIRFSCRTVRAAAKVNPTGTVISTVNPALPQAAVLGLVARVSGGWLSVDAVGTELIREQLRPGDCKYVIHGDSHGLVLSRDNQRLAHGPVGVLPDVDMLTTSVAALPAATPADLGVALKLDDEFAARPTGLKSALTILLALALVGVGLSLRRLDRAGSRVPTRWRFPRAGPTDLAVTLALLGWLLLAPTTDDDGYYAAMAANSRVSGFVGNYYQLYDQSFVPFTWFYQLLSWWQTVAGTAPVAQRLLAFTAGLLTWASVRTLVSSAVRGWSPTPRMVRRSAAPVAGVVFLAWWLPFDMGVRPENVVALLGMIALLCVWLAIEQRRLLLLWAAFATAGVGLATHTTGFVVLAPLAAGGGALWDLVKVKGHRMRTVGRALAVASGGGTAALVGFANGSLRDFLRAQQIFLDIQPREYWYTEYLRWGFLLGGSPMGNYAKRAPVLVALVGLVWFVALAAASRGRSEPMPAPLRLVGWTLVASFGLLWLTPSKWTHHFGALAGVGPVFLTLLLLAAVPLARRTFARDPLPLPLLTLAAGSVLIAFALAGQGKNAWPYASMYGFADPNTPPHAGPFWLSSPQWWAITLADCLVFGWVFTRLFGDRFDQRGQAALRGVVTLVVVGLLLNVSYLLGSFALAARHTAHSWSLWAANVTDPTARRCVAADAVSVFDPYTARPLPEADTQPEARTSRLAQNRAETGGARDRTGFERAGGYYYQPPVELGTGAATTTWGSLVSADGQPPDRNTGEMRTPWYELPAQLEPDETLAVLVAGSLSQGNSLTAEYARRDGDTLVALSTAVVDDPLSDPRWRSAILTPPPGAELVALHAIDGSGAPGGWLAFAAPAVQHLVPLTALLPAAKPVALAWQIAFQYPCLRQPRIRNGITEPPAAAVLWSDGPSSGTQDATWQPFRGGIDGQVQRSQSVLELTARVRGAPLERRVEVLMFDTRLASAAYTLSTRLRWTNGWSQDPPTPTRTLNELERCIQTAAASAATATRCEPR